LAKLKGLIDLKKKRKKQTIEEEGAENYNGSEDRQEEQEICM
jgi:hypothetical protein